jgi:hypothetical protein
MDYLDRAVQAMRDNLCLALGMPGADLERIDSFILADGSTYIRLPDGTFSDRWEA